jgi:hypothetical protein
MPPGGKGATCSDMGNKMKVLYVASISNLKDGTYQELDSNCSTFRDEVYVDRDDYEKAKIDVECAKGLVTSIVRQFIPQMLRLGRPPRFDASSVRLGQQSILQSQPSRWRTAGHS